MESVLAVLVLRKKESVLIRFMSEVIKLRSKQPVMPVIH